MATSERAIPVAAKKRRGTKSVLAVVGAVIVLTGVGIGLSRVGAGASQPLGATPSATSTDAKDPATAEARTEPPRQVGLYVSAGAKVEVDGVEVAHAQDGTIVLAGALGSTHRVRAVLGAREITTVVAITETGAVPPAVIVPTASASHESRPPTATPPRAPRASSSSAPGPSTPRAPTAKGGLVTSFE